MLEPEISAFIRTDVLDRFMRYVRVDTTADPRASNQSGPSSPGQLDLLRILESEIAELGLVDVVLDPRGYLYGTLPAQTSNYGEPFGLLAHVDTSPDQPGRGVKPRLVEGYDGSPIEYPDDPQLRLTTADSSELKHFIGDTIVVASGGTLLGADDKAGVAEIMTSLATFQKFPQLPHGEIRVCFTRDEEIGRGVNEIDLQKLPKYCYTMDGSFPGELEAECFDAWHVALEFHGVGVHPGFAHGKLVNASAIAARFIAALPARETPEQTSGREGFFHLVQLSGSVEQCSAEFIVRDFECQENRRRISLIEQLARDFEVQYHGLKIDIKSSHTYENMREEIAKHPVVVEKARQAIADAGLTVVERPIRGGTDGSRLSKMGHPTPNIFAGGLLFHSRKEWVALSSLVKATEVILHLARAWTKR